MKEYMIYEENKPSFTDLINNLNKLRKQLQAVEWIFELKFPPTNTYSIPQKTNLETSLYTPIFGFYQQWSVFYCG